MVFLQAFGKSNQFCLNNSERSKANVNNIEAVQVHIIYKYAIECKPASVLRLRQLPKALGENIDFYGLNTPLRQLNNEDLKHTQRMTNISNLEFHLFHHITSLLIIGRFHKKMQYFYISYIFFIVFLVQRPISFLT